MTVLTLTLHHYLGLGGTSLMNANVFMEADKKVLALKAWPKEIRTKVDALDECMSPLFRYQEHLPSQAVYSKVTS